MQEPINFVKNSIFKFNVVVRTWFAASCLFIVSYCRGLWLLPAAAVSRLLEDLKPFQQWNKTSEIQVICPVWIRHSRWREAVENGSRDSDTHCFSKKSVCYRLCRSLEFAQRIPMMLKNLKQSCRFHPCTASTILVLTNVRACIRTTPIYLETPKHFHFESSHPRWRTWYDLCQSSHYDLERILVQTRVPANGRVTAPRAGRSQENRHLCCCSSPHRQTWNCNRQQSVLNFFWQRNTIVRRLLRQSKTETCFHAAQMRGPVMASVSSDFDDQMRSLSARVSI
jgi:hypothetical protein